MDRKILLKIDAIFFYIFSIPCFLMSLLLIIAPFFGIFTTIFDEYQLSKGVLIGIAIFGAIIYLGISLAYFFAAKYLWNYKKTGGIIAIILFILGFLGSWIFLIMGPIGIILFSFEVMLLIFLILGWKELS